jgi:hypothetical protein
MPQGSWVATGMMDDLDQHPTDVAVALLGNMPMVGVFGALVN